MSTLYSVTATLNKDGIVEDSVAVFENEDDIVVPGAFYFVEDASLVWDRPKFEPRQYVSIALYAEDEADAVEKFYYRAIEDIQAYKVYVKYSDFVHDVDPCESADCEYGLTLKMDEIEGWIWGTCGYDVDVQVCDFLGDELTNYDAMRKAFIHHTDRIDDGWLPCVLATRSYKYVIETALECNAGTSIDKLLLANNLNVLVIRLTSETKRRLLNWRNINNDTYKAVLPESIIVRKIDDCRIELVLSSTDDAQSYDEEEAYFTLDKTVDPYELARTFAVEITNEYAHWDSMLDLFAAISRKEAQG